MSLVKLPVLIINFKTYTESSGKRGIELARVAEKVANEFGVSFVVVPQLIDTKVIAQEVAIDVFSQHVDPYAPGSATGHIDIESLVEGGISGTLLNHSERRLEIAQLEESIQKAKNNGLKTVVCAGTIALSQAVSAFSPWAVAMEPPELIGGDVSVTSKPDVVRDAVSAVKKGSEDVIPLTGAGVKTAEHVGVAIDLGTKGVLLASGVVKTKNPYEVMTEMAKVMTKY
ncbi:MAG: triose-phosphate isomerase [Asgard group archaeon]|nr:triose-phosphate isomerase [Asgard group archaeon]